MELSPSTSGLRWAKRIMGPLVAVDRSDCFSSDNDDGDVVVVFVVVVVVVVVMVMVMVGWPM